MLKLQDPTVREIIVTHDIICLVESHTDTESTIAVEGYTTWHNPRSKSRHKGKMYGGLVALVRNTLVNGIKDTKTKTEGCIWLEMQAKFFNRENNILICFVYIEPGINKKADPLKHIRSGLENWDSSNPLILMGDINARIGDQPKSTADYNYKHVECIPQEERETPATLQRTPTDKGKNMYGTELIKLSRACNLTVLNGTLKDHSNGGFTCFTQPNHPTMIDLSLVSTEDLHLIKKIEVLQYCPDLSDHSPISITTSLHHIAKITKKDPNNTGVKVELTKAHWTQEYKEDVKNNLASEISRTECAEMLHNLTGSKNGADIDKTVEALNQTLFSAMAGNCKVTFTKIPNRRKNTTKPVNQAWFDEECDTTRKALRKVNNYYRKARKPLPQRYYGMRKQYGNLITRKEAKHRGSILHNMRQHNKSNPRLWWNLLRKLNYKHEHDPIPTDITVQQWTAHFKSLLNETPASLPRKNMQKTVTASEILTMHMANKQGNGPITTLEVTKEINNLSQMKAAYFDRIPNEAIQLLHRAQLTTLPILFNHILQTGSFPREWSQAYLKPLFKKGNRLEPENYRGIAISPCLGKAFNAIINNRLETLMDDKGISNDMQIGFERNHRISDHLMVIRTILDQARCCGQDIFIAFVDFKQAYDRVNRKLLFQKLIDYCFPSKLIKIIIDQYQKVQYCVLTPEGRTIFFNSNLGLKQGDTMSPRLFNLFIMDIIGIFGKECDPAYLQGLAVGVLLFADDLALISTSQTGLQKALQKLEIYSIENHLTVNTVKTKSLAIKKLHGNYNQLPTLTFLNQQIEWVQGFNYLGVFIDDKGKMQGTQAPITTKAKRAQFKLMNLGRSLSFDTKIWLHQTMVDPILLHGVEVWGLEGHQKTIERKGIYDTLNEGGFSPMGIEKVKRQYIRLQMGLPRTAPILAIRGDSGIYPLYIETIARMIQYYEYLSKAPPTSLLGTMLKTQLQLANRRQPSWLGTVKEVLKQVAGPNMSIPDKATITDKLKNQYNQHWYEHLWGRKRKRASPKLKWYRKFKPTMKKEDYLNGPRTEIQQAMARFRAGCHNLPVERGRWEKIKFKHRLCPKCSLKAVGDELHIFNCTGYKHLKVNGKPKAYTKHQFINMMREPSNQTRTFIRDVLKTNRYLSNNPPPLTLINLLPKNQLTV